MQYGLVMKLRQEPEVSPESVNFAIQVSLAVQISKLLPLGFGNLIVHQFEPNELKANAFLFHIFTSLSGVIKVVSKSSDSSQ